MQVLTPAIPPQENNNFKLKYKRYCHMFNRNVAIHVCQETQYTVSYICQVTDRNMFLVISTSQSCQDIHIYVLQTCHDIFHRSLYRSYQHIMIKVLPTYHDINPTNIK